METMTWILESLNRNVTSSMVFTRTLAWFNNITLFGYLMQLCFKQLHRCCLVRKPRFNDLRLMGIDSNVGSTFTHVVEQIKINGYLGWSIERSRALVSPKAGGLMQGWESVCGWAGGIPLTENENRIQVFRFL